MEEKPPSTEESIGLMWDTMVDMWVNTLSHIPLIIIGIVVLVITWLIAKGVDLGLKNTLYGRRRMRRSLADLIRQLISVVIWLVGIVIAVVVFFPGMTPTKVLAGLGIGSVALGFAFKDIVENFLAGILILWKFPFDPGDFIRIDGTVGKVEEITIRMTLIRKTDGELVILPNARLFKEPVEVLTSRIIRRITVICGVAYGEDVDECRKVIEEAVAECNTVSKQKPIEIFAQEFADSSINFEVTWWCGSTPLEVRKSRDQVVAGVKRALDDAGIEIPFPYRTLTFAEPLQLKKGSEQASDGDTGEQGV